MSQTVLLSVRVSVDLQRTEHCVTASCSFLDAPGKGRSADEALNALAKSLTEYFENRFDCGQFDSVFRDNGYCAHAGKSEIPTGRFLDIGIKLTVREKRAINGTKKASPEAAGGNAWPLIPSLAQ
jgi:hypothetical protein